MVRKQNPADENSNILQFCPNPTRNKNESFRSFRSKTWLADNPKLLTYAELEACFVDRKVNNEFTRVELENCYVARRVNDELTRVEFEACYVAKKFTDELKYEEF